MIWVKLFILKKKGDTNIYDANEKSSQTLVFIYILMREVLVWKNENIYRIYMDGW